MGTELIKKYPTEVFTDREIPQKVFREAIDSVMLEMPPFGKLNELTADKQEHPKKHVLNFYGFAGLGKTSLLEKLVEEIKRRNVGATALIKQNKQREIKYIQIELDGNVCTRTSSRCLIKKIMNMLSLRYNIDEFPRTLYAMYLSYQKGGDPFEENLVDKRKEKTTEFANSILDLVLNTVPCGNYISILKDIVQKFFPKKSISEDDVEKVFLRSLREDEDGKTEIKRMKPYGLQYLVGNLPHFFSADLKAIVKKYGPVVFFIDTYEYKSDDSSENRTIIKGTEELLQLVISKVDYAVWVIAGREKLCEYEERKWGIIEDVDEHALDRLCDEDIKKYMGYAGIEDCLFSVFRNLSEGIPYVLDLLYDRYLELQEEGDHLNPDNYKLDEDKLAERYLRYFDDKGNRFFYSLLSIRSWTDEQIKGLKPYLEDYDKSTYEMIKKMSIVKRVGEEGYAFHDSAWKILMNFVPNKFKEVKETTEEALLKYYVDIIKHAELPENTNEIKKIATLNVKGVYKTFYNIIYPEILKLIKLWRLAEVEEILSAFELRYDSASDCFKFYYNCAQFWLFTKRGHYKKAGEVAKKCRDLADNLDDEKLDVEAGRLEAEANLNLGNTKLALEQSLKNLEDIKEMFGRKDSNYLQGQMRVASVFSKLGKWKESCKLHEDILEELQDFGAERRDWAMCYSEIGKDLISKGMYESAIDKLNNAYSKLIKKGKENPETLNILLDKQVCLQYLKKYDEAINLIIYCREQIKELGFGFDFYSMRVAYESGRIFLRFGKYEEALKMFNMAYYYYNEHLGPEHQLTLEVLYEIYSFYLYPAVEQCPACGFDELYEKLKNNENFGENHPFTLRTLRKIGDCYLVEHQFQDALAKYEECYQEQRKFLTEESVDCVETLEKISWCLLLQKKYDEAVESYKKLFENTKQIHEKGVSYSIGALQINLLTLCTSIGYEGALDFLSKLYSLSIQVFGEEHKYTIQALYQKANFFAENYKYDKAIDDFKKCYEICVKTSDQNDEYTLFALKGIAKCSFGLKKYSKATEYWTQLYHALKQKYNEDYEETLDALFWKGCSLFKLKRYEEALKDFTKCCELRVIVIGKESEETLNALYWKAESLYCLGRYNEALDDFKKCYGLCTTQTCNNSLFSLNGIAKSLYKIGNYDKALECYAKLYEIRIQLGLRKRPDTLKILFWKAMSLLRLDRNKEALECFTECYNLRVEVLSERNRETLETLYYKAHTLFVLNMDMKSLENYEKCYRLSIKYLGTDEFDTIKVLETLANLRFKMQEYNIALMYFSKLYEIEKEFLTEKKYEATIATTLTNKAYTLFLLGKYEDALEDYNRSYASWKQIEGMSGENTLFVLNQMAKCLSEIIGTIFRENNGIKDNKKAFDYIRRKACILACLGKIKPAIHSLEYCYKMCVKLFGPEDDLTEKVFKSLQALLVVAVGP